MQTTYPVPDDRVRYADCMGFVRYRIQVIDRFLGRKVTTGFAIPDLETVCLQFRMIFELVVMSSLCANRERCEEVRRRFDKMWNVGEIVSFVEQLNPNFFPVPVRRKVEPNGNGTIWHLKEGFLTKSALIQAHGQCGEILHAANPYSRSTLDTNAWQSKLQTWREQVVTLLECHVARLLDSESEWWVLTRFGSKKPVEIALMRKLGA